MVFFLVVATSAAKMLTLAVILAMADRTDHG
jgi:hypothetical protein